MRIKRDKLDEIFSLYIRLRAKGYCERCGAYKGVKGLQCSHFIGRARRSVRWDEDNAAALCFACHIYFTSQPFEHTEWFTKRLGDKLELLRGRERQIWPKPDRKLLELYYSAKIQELLALVPE